MKPGRELDRLVAEVMGYYNFNQPLGPGTQYFADKEGWGATIKCVPAFSTIMNAAMEAWEWLEQNHPQGGTLILGKASEYDELGYPRNGRPGVCRVTSGWPCNNIEPVATGETYPHAICLAVLEASKMKIEPHNMVKCPQCKGEALIRRTLTVDLQQPENITDYQLCPTCNGRGKITGAVS